MTVLAMSRPLQPIVTVNSGTAASATTSLSASFCADDDRAFTAGDSDGSNLRLVIVPSPPITLTDSYASYSWEDFPVIIQEENRWLVSSSPSTSGSTWMEVEGDDVDCSSSSSSLSFSSMSDDDDDENDVATNDHTRTIESSTSSPTSPPKRTVRFASALEVRTYSIVLGDHPLCESIPISLGWDYDPTPCFVDLETHEDSKHHYSNNTVSYRYHGHQQQYHSHTSAAAHGVYRLSYLERKQLLIQVGGYSDHQLMVEERMIQQQQQHRDGIPSFSLNRLKYSQRSESLQHLVRDEDQESDDDDGIMLFSVVASAADM